MKKEKDYRNDLEKVIDAIEAFRYNSIRGNIWVADCDSVEVVGNEVRHKLKCQKVTKPLEMP